MPNTSSRRSKPPTSSSNRRRGADASPLRPGFKAQADRLAAEIRAALGLTHRDRLDPTQLAAHFEIQVAPISKLESAGLSDEALRHLLHTNPEAWSAFYVRVPGHPAHIFFNDSHAATRQASDITHECAHGILGHELAEAFDGLGCRHWNAEQEAEVDYLAPALLVTRDGALWALRRGMSEAEAAAHFGVSVALFRMRANMTGANRQLESERRRYPRRATGA